MTDPEIDRARVSSLEARIEAAFADRALLGRAEYASAVLEVLELLTRGALRVATPRDDVDAQGWAVHAWLKRAILLYFALRPLEALEAGPLQYQDKIPLQRPSGARLVPGAVVRYGAHVAKGVVVMPGFVNVGAYVGEGTMVDTWATVGSCAQVGRDVHLAGGVGIGGVLEPPSAQPVIIEDGAFLGSRAVVVEGVRVGREAVLGAGVVLTASTTIVDVTGPEPVERKGYVPPRSVVIPGTRMKHFAAGEYGVPCALIVGRRGEATDKKVSLEQALREFEVPA